MRILFFSYAYPNPWRPEVGTFNQTMIAGLAREHEVRVVSPVAFVERWKHRPQPADLEAIPGVTVDYATYYYTPKMFRTHYGRFLDWSVGSQLRRAMWEFRPDVVLAYWAHPDGEVAIRAAHELGIPAVLMVGGSDVLLLARKGRRRAAILNVLHAADSIIAVSHDIAETARKDGIAARKIHVVGRGIDCTVFLPGDKAEARRELGLPLDRPVLLGVGRLVSVKAWHDWLDACWQLVGKGLKPKGYIFGDGPLRGELEYLIRQFRLEGTVELRGPQPQAELARWYRAADLTVLSSVSEGIPNVLLETMACGGSFVATNVGGIPEIADPVFDRLVPPGQPIGLAAAITDRLNHAPPAGLARRWEPWSSDTAARRIAQVLESTVKQLKKANPKLVATEATAK